MNLAPTAATQASFSIDTIKELMDGFDPAALLPEIPNILAKTTGLCRLALLVGPIVLLVLGIAYLLFPPKEANWYFGYKTYFGMGSITAWRFTQRLAGLVLGGTGLVLTGVMLVISAGLSSLPPMDMLLRVVHCLFWQAGLALAANLAVNVTAAVLFNAKGELRRANS